MLMKTAQGREGENVALETSISWKTRKQRAGDWKVMDELSREAEENMCQQKPSRVGTQTLNDCGRWFALKNTNQLPLHI